MTPLTVPGWTLTLAHDGEPVATWAATPSEIALPGAHLVHHVTGKAVSILDATHPIRSELRRAAEAADHPSLFDLTDTEGTAA